MNSQLQVKQTFTKESLKKQFRLSEFLAKKIISSIAFLSIAVIFLIFILIDGSSLSKKTSCALWFLVPVVTIVRRME